MHPSIVAAVSRAPRVVSSISYERSVSVGRSVFASVPRGETRTREILCYVIEEADLDGRGLPRDERRMSSWKRVDHGDRLHGVSAASPQLEEI